MAENMISIIAAMGRNRVIGKNNGLIWHLPADLKHFKKVTMGKPVIMGRKTWDSVGRPLPGRTNIVVTRKSGYSAEGALTAGSPEEAVKLVAGEPEIFIAGGGEIYRQSLPLAQKIYLTIVNDHFQGDTYFPELSQDEWKIEEEWNYPADEKNIYSMVFRILYHRRACF